MCGLLDLFDSVWYLVSVVVFIVEYVLLCWLSLLCSVVNRWVICLVLFLEMIELMCGSGFSMCSVLELKLRLYICMGLLCGVMLVDMVRVCRVVFLFELLVL